jgi:hypothetical protein
VLRRDQRQGDERRARQQRDQQHHVSHAADNPRAAIRGDAHRVVREHEDQLVEDQDPDHRLLGDAGLRCELRQEDHVDRPGQREEELDHREVETDAALGSSHSVAPAVAPLRIRRGQRRRLGDRRLAIVARDERSALTGHAPGVLRRSGALLIIAGRSPHPGEWT